MNKWTKDNENVINLERVFGQETLVLRSDVAA